jgi:hypothetical protein
MAQSETLKEAKRRLQKAQAGQQIHADRVDDIYRYMMPWRRRHYQQAGAEGRLEDFDELFDSTGIDTLEDFAADMGHTFTAPNDKWVDVEPVMEFDQGDRRRIDEQLKKYRDVVFDHIERSNFHEAAQEAYPDLFPGTMAMLIEDLDPGEPIHCEAVPLPELLIDRAPRGRGVGPRFRQFHVPLEHIEVLWPDAELPEAWQEQKKRSPDTKKQITWGLWRDHSRKDTEVWKYVVFSNDHLLLEEELEGKGSCPLVVARWNPDGVTAYGVGPGHKALPSVKTANKIVELNLRAADKAVDPVVIYPDDGTLAPGKSVVPGDWLPKMPNSSDPFVLNTAGNVDLSMLALEEQRMSIRRAGFQDKPHQRGKTPPTATQFLEEQMDTIKRMGAPAGRLITEWQYAIFQRFAYLLEQRGTLPPIELNGERIALKPVSQYTKQKQEQDALRLQRWVQTVGEVAPQAVPAVVDLFEYANRQADFMGVQKRDLVRNPQQLAQIAEQLGGTGLLQGGGA